MNRHTFRTATVSIVLLLTILLPTIQPAFIGAAPPPPVTPAPTLEPDEPEGQPYKPAGPGVLSAEAERDRAKQAIEQVLNKYLALGNFSDQVELDLVLVENEWAHGTAQWQTQERPFSGPIHIIAHRSKEGLWQALIPSYEGLYMHWLDAVPASLISLDEKTQMRILAHELDTVQTISTTMGSRLPANESNSPVPQTTPELPSLSPTPTPSNLLFNFSNVAYVTGTVQVEQEFLAQVEKALRESFDTVPEFKYYSISDIRNLDNWRIVSLVGLDQVDENHGWTLDNASWIGIALFHCNTSGNWSGAVEGTPAFSSLLLQVPDDLLDDTAKTSLDPLQRHPVLFSIDDVFPWEQGSQMMYGTQGVHNAGFFSGWSAVDFLSDGNTAAGHAPNRLRASVSGTITYVCRDSQSVAIRVGDLLYVHLLDNGNLNISHYFSRGDEIGQLKTGSFNDRCGYASQSSSWFHVHWGFPNTSAFNVGAWTLNTASQTWQRGGETRGTGSWFTAEASSSSGCANYSFSGVVLFDGDECSGSRLEFSSPSNLTNVSGSGWNDRAQSIHVASGWSVKTYEHDNGNGASRCVNNSMWNLSVDYFTDSSVLMDRAISSIQVFNNSTCNGTTPSGQARLYSSANYGGSVVWNGGTGFSNDPNANSYSLEIPSGWSAKTWRGDNRSGEERCWSSSVSNLQDHEWHLAIQSIEVFDHNVCSTQPGGQARLYSSANYGGSVVWNGGTGFSNDPNANSYSLEIPSGWSAKTWRGDNRSGEERCWSSSVSNLQDHEWHLAIQSIEVFDYVVCVPAPPALSSPTNGIRLPQSTNVVLQWHSTAHAAQYQAELAGSTIQTISSGWQNGTSWSMGQLWVGNYSYHAEARNSSLQWSGWSDRWQFTIIPNTPTGLSASVISESRIDLSWANPGGDMEGFRIYRDGVGIAVVGSGITNYQDDDLSCGHDSYSYYVVAYKGSFESDHSNTVSAATQTCPSLIPDPPVLSFPANGARLPQSTNVVLQWQTAENAVHYQAELWNSALGLVGTGWQTGTSWAIGSLEVGDYSYHAEARNSSLQWSGWSDWWQFTIIPNTPTGLSASVISESRIDLSWANPGGDMEGFRIYRDGIEVAVVSSGTTGYQDTGLNNYTTYVYYVVSYKGGFESNHSNPATATTLTGCHDPGEPGNNTPLGAVSISVGQDQVADICLQGDQDLFKFTGTADDRIVIDIDAQVDGSALDSYVYLLGSDGSSVLAENDDERSGELLDSRLGYQLPYDGTFYIKVRAWGHPSVGGPNYSYTLRLLVDNESPDPTSIQSPVTGAWLDPNLQRITVSANDGASGMNRVEFLWHSADWENSDWIWLGADLNGTDGWNWDLDTSGLDEQRGGCFYIWAFDWATNWTGAGAWNLGIDRTPPATDVSVSLKYGDAPFRDFWVWWSGSDNLSGIASSDVQYRDGPAGPWTDLAMDTALSYMEFVGQDGHTYSFRARARDQAGNLGVYSDGSARHTVQVCSVSGDSYEPDNSAGAALWARTDGTVQTRNVHMEGDQDWVKFYAAAGVVYTLETVNAGGHADTVLTLYDMDGSTVIDSNDDYPDLGLASHLDWQPSASGVYYARVHHWDPWAYGCTTGYEFTIRTDDETPPTGSVRINAGDAYAESTAVTLDLSSADSGTGVEQVIVFNRSDLSGATWIEYSSSLNWTLASGVGPKTVYVRFRDRAGNVSPVYSDDIIYYEPLTADFSAEVTTGPAPLTVHFTDLSDGPVAGWEWDFGDGQSSTAQNPVHVYQEFGAYPVTLTVRLAGDAANYPRGTSVLARPGYVIVQYRVYLPLTLRTVK